MERKTGLWSLDTLNFFLKSPLYCTAVVMRFISVLAEVNLPQTVRAQHSLIFVLMKMKNEAH